MAENFFNNFSTSEDMMNESHTRKQDGEGCESFNLTEWLTNEVKLPQYKDAFLEHGFELPFECSSIDESTLDALGVVKIGHRKRLLVSCQKLADKWGLSSQDLATAAKTSDILEQQSIPDEVQPPGDVEPPPQLPPKIGKRTRPSPPPRNNMAEQEVNIDSTVEGEDSNLPAKTHDNSNRKNSDSINTNLFENEEIKSIENSSSEGDLLQNRNNETALSPGLPSGHGEYYEPIWEASEGEPLPFSPVEPTPQTPYEVESIDNNANVDVKVEEKFSNDIEHDKQINAQAKLTNSASGSGPPPIPPRADLDDASDKDIQSYVNIPSVDSASLVTVPDKPSPPLDKPSLPLDKHSPSPDKHSPPPFESKIRDVATQETIVPQKKKIPPKKPPRGMKPKPVSMFIEPAGLPASYAKPQRRSLGSADTAQSGDDVIYENEVLPLPVAEQVSKNQTTEEKSSILESKPSVSVSDISDDDNIYGNAESFQKAPVKKTKSASEVCQGSSKDRRPIPAPRRNSANAPGKSKVNPIAASTGDDGGSCTEDDLSGSDQDEMPEQIESDYDTVNFPIRTSIIQSRHSSKEGYLFKQGGQQNNKGWKKRWVVFDGEELRYYKDKGHTAESLQMVPVAIMREVRIVTEDTKRARFDLACAGRTYMFALGMEEMDVIQVWAQILMSTIIQVRKKDETNISQDPGGDMFDPDKKGFLKKQGNNVVVDWKKRFVAVKDGMMAYYHNYEDFIVASPINTIQMNIASVRVDPKSPTRFQLVTPHRTYLFQCEDEDELRSWIAALEKAIQLALSDRRVINKIWENRSNRVCADCGEKDPVWASVNLVVCVCARCIGVHRNLGVQSSKPRSLLMDEKIWSPSLVKLMVEVGNEISNKFWQYRLPEDDRISPDCSSQAREEFIRKKYVGRMYRHVSPLYGDPTALGEALLQSVCTDDIEKTIQLVFCNADVKYVSSDDPESKTPYQLAELANQELQMEFLMQNGANANAIYAEPTPVENTYESTYETVSDIVAPPVKQTSLVPIVYEKEGFLHKKAPNGGVWRKRLFMLKGRELWYDKGEKDGHGLIKLKDVDEYVYHEPLNLDIVTSERTYNLRADTKEEAFGWYTTLRNKQVFQVPLEFQELGSDGVPHLVAKSLQFVETHGLEAEGIYRKNGNKSKIKTLKKLFNQDAASVMILREEYEAHDVAGLLKEYFRELPDPLMTEDAYAHFITASLTPEHNEKLNMYKTSLGRLPEVNRITLKTVISHLDRVSSHSKQNKMKLENISLIFGPTLMSNEGMGAMDTATINQEFTVIGDFITYYKWLFDVGDDEIAKDQKIAEAMNKMSQLSSKGAQVNDFNELTLDIYAISTAKECSRITVYSKTKASEICQELVSKRAMPPDMNWTLFQSVNGEPERPFPATEKVLATVIETGKYSRLNKGSCLIVKENYVQQKIEAYALQNDTSFMIAGSYQTMKEVKRKENWKKLFIKLEKGTLTVHKTLKSRDEIDAWPLSETTMYIGVDRDKKPLTAYGFTIVRIGKDGQCVYRYICLDEEREQYRWINVFLKSKYPGVDDLWTDPEVNFIGFYAEAMPVKVAPVPRQRTPSNKSQAGVSANVLSELKEKQLRKSSRR